MIEALKRIPERLSVAGRRVVARWYAASVRTQIILAIAAVLTFATCFAATVVIWNGRKAVVRETQASVKFAERYLVTFLNRLENEKRLNELHSLLPREIATLRHAEVFIKKADGPAVRVYPEDSLGKTHIYSERAPDWFSRLVAPARDAVPDRMVFNQQMQFRILIVGRGQDEVDEIWEELTDLAVIWLGTISLLLVGLYVVLGRILDPLTEVSRGLVALKAGERQRRVSVPPVQELGAICNTFNDLAESLDRTRDENGELYRQIVSVQEEERRQVAIELHDEAGPCLFGITANTESIQRFADRLPEDDKAHILSRTGVILSIVDRLKGMNRAMLRRLRPVAIGKVSLHEMIEDLVSEFAESHPDISFMHQVALDRRSYGEAIDLTIYRCIQEGFTNAVRHANPKECSVEVRLGPPETIRRDAPEDKRSLVFIHLADDGIGLANGLDIGFGLGAMRERVLMHGGTFFIGQNKPAGLLITITIPFDAETRPAKRQTRELEME